MVGEAGDEGRILRDHFVSQFDPFEGHGISGPEFEGINSFGAIGCDVVIMRDKGSGEILAIYGANVGIARELVIVPGEIKNVDSEIVVVLVLVNIKKVKFGIRANVGNEEFNLPYVLSSGEIVAFGKRIVVFLGGEEDVAVEN